MADASFAEHLSSGDIVQIDPENQTNKAFGGCLMVVTEVKSWGVQGYVQTLGADRSTRGDQAYIRLKWEEVELTGGRAAWMLGDETP